MADTIRFYLSGGEQNADPAKSLGGPPSQTEVADLFSDIDPDMAATGSTELRCVYLLVAEGGPVENPRIWFSDVSDRSAMEVAVDASGKNGVAQIVDSGATPSEVAFGRPTDYVSGLDLLGPYNEGDFVALWIKRISPSGAKSGKGYFNLRVRGLTAAENRAEERHE